MTEILQTCTKDRPMPRITTDLITTALSRSLVLHQELRRQLMIDLLLTTNAPVNDIVAVVNWVMRQPAD